MGPLIRRRLDGAVQVAIAVSRALQKGSRFPAASRRPVGLAPGGTESTRPPAGLAARLLREHALFVHTRHRVPVPGLERGVSVLHLSDVHLRSAGSWLDALVSRLRDLRPDLLVLTGDVLTRGWTEEAAHAFLSALPPAPLGRLAVMGNWEYWGGVSPQLFGQILGAHGIRLLVDGWVPAGPLNVAGTDDLLAGSPDVDAALDGLPAGRPAIALTHSPAIFPSLARSPVRLVLAGHSHAGQVRLPRLGSPFLPRGTGPYAGGWYRHDGVDLFVSRGIGWSIAPFRLRCPPEIAWLDLAPAPAVPRRELGF